jgi:hypothetical protein
MRPAPKNARYSCGKTAVSPSVFLQENGAPSWRVSRGGAGVAMRIVGKMKGIGA